MRLLCGIALAVGAVATACGPGATGGPAQPTQPSGSGLQTAGTAAQPGIGPSTAEQQPAAEDRCKRLIDHVVTLAIAERPADQKVNADEQKNIASQLRTSWEPKCSAMTERGYTCAVNAPTLAELDRCGG
jgi:hypothetical protein